MLGTYFGRGLVIALVLPAAIATGTSLRAQSHADDAHRGRPLFEDETFGGNGRTCLTCHGRETGTVSPSDALERFTMDPRDPLFRGDGSDDGLGNGVSRMLRDATILVRVPLAPNVSLARDPTARSVVLRRGVLTTLHSPALDPVLMWDGRQPNLPSQALGAILGHAEARRTPSDDELQQIAGFQRTRRFFSSPEMWQFAQDERAPSLPEGRTVSEQRGRRFFEDSAFVPPDGKAGLCAFCHSGSMLNETNEFIPAPPRRRGGRFQAILVSDLNAAGNALIDFVFTNPDGTTKVVSSPDPGRALITGDALDGFQSLNAFKIPTLWGINRTAPYFHDNSAKTLEDVLRHYAEFFKIVTDPARDGDPPIIVTEEDQADIVAFLKLLR
jgi:cytochrome c peroxidase